MASSSCRGTKKGAFDRSAAVLSSVSVPALPVFTLALVIVCICVPFHSSADENGAGAEEGGSVMVIPVDGVIDLGLAFFVKRALDAAERDGFDHVVLELDTLGGRVDAALDIRDSLRAAAVPVTAYVAKRAISAGALICLATKKIAMAPGSTIGAATPVAVGPTGGKEVGEKEISFVRSEFRATAESNGHSPLLAEAMVDPETEVYAVFEEDDPLLLSASEVEELKERTPHVRIETISAKDKLLTLTSSEAEKLGLSSLTAQSLDDVVRHLGLSPANIAAAKLSWSELMVRFITHPIVAGLLLTFGVLGILFELQMPGWGVSGTIGIVLLLLFFGGHYLAGLASVIDILLFAAGLTLLAMEIFVIPGTGITGLLGIICLIASIYLALVKRPMPEFFWEYQRMNSALMTLVVVMAAVMVGAFLMWKALPQSRLRALMVLSASESAKAGYVASKSLEALVGQSGKSLTHLRPTGRALIGGEPIEVQTEGEFIERDRPVRVVRVMGNKVFVAEQRREEMETS